MHKFDVHANVQCSCTQIYVIYMYNVHAETLYVNTIHYLNSQCYGVDNISLKNYKKAVITKCLLSNKLLYTSVDHNFLFKQCINFYINLYYILITSFSFKQ